METRCRMCKEVQLLPEALVHGWCMQCIQEWVAREKRRKAAYDRSRASRRDALRRRRELGRRQALATFGGSTEVERKEFPELEREVEEGVAEDMEKRRMAVETRRVAAEERARELLKLEEMYARGEVELDGTVVRLRRSGMPVATLRAGESLGDQVVT